MGFLNRACLLNKAFKTQKLLKTEQYKQHMVVKILGIADLMAALSILLFRVAPNTGSIKTLLIVFAIYVIIKGLIFIKSITSIIDIAAGAFMVLAFYGYFNFLTWIAAIWLTQKGVISLFS